MIDTHAHLQMPDFAVDWPKALDNAGQAGIEHVVVVGFDIKSSKAAIAMAENDRRLLVGVGIHPHDASSMDDSAIDELGRLARHPKVVAIGETGLDFYRNRSPRESQINAFLAQLKIAEQTQLPIIIHDRDAHGPVADILSEHVEVLAGGVMHCFSGDAQLAKKILDWGFYISVAGPVTYPNAGDLRSAIQQIPIERIVIETDAPYLSPQPKRGKRNEPAFVRFVAEKLACIKGMSIDDIDHITSINARKLFGLPLEKSRESDSVSDTATKSI